ncbi:GtrA family protein [Streptomyces sp. NPDC056716]|uniref:GtrA family protein n=1 Tax=unclassified Streptomyces TaxID=2593676 RepID=UPI003679BED5
MARGSSGLLTTPTSGFRPRLRRLTREVAKFGAVGGIGLLVNLLVFNLVRAVTDLQVVRASVIATVVAIVFNYIGFRYFTYRDRDKNRRTREMSLFLLFSAVGLVIENGVLYLATYGLGWDTPMQNNIFKFLGIGIATLFRFWSYRSWVFRALPAREPQAAAGTAGTVEAAGAVGGAESFLEKPQTVRQRQRERQQRARARV